MGNCPGNGGKDVTEQVIDRHNEASSSLPRARNVADQLKETPKTPQMNNKRTTKRHGRDGSATAAATAGGNTPALPLKLPCDASDTAKEHRKKVTGSDDTKTPLHQPTNSTATTHAAAAVEAAKSVDRCQEADNSSPNALSKTQDVSRDSVAIRMEQGSSYIWLRNTYSNPLLKPTQLLTLDCMRELRNHSEAFRRLWSVLGEAACVIGPYATASNPGSPPAPLEDGKEKDEEDFYHMTSFFVNNEAHAINKDDKRPRTAKVTNASAMSADGQQRQQYNLSSGGGEDKGREMSEVRVPSPQHIFIEGDATQHDPIVCRGAPFRGGHVWIHKLRTRCCCIFESLNGVDLNDCTDAFIVLAPTAGAVSLSNCHRCLIIAAAAQLRVQSCDSIILSVNVAGFPSIERSTSIGFAPMLGWYAYSNIPIDFRRASLSLFTNNYSTVRDVTPPTRSNAATLLLPGPSCAPKNKGNAASDGGLGGARTGSTAPLLPVSNFIYVDLWELEAAVWKAMAEQRWGQLISEADKAVTTATAVAAVQGSQGGSGTLVDNEVPLKSSAQFLEALTPAQSLLTITNVKDVGGGGDVRDDEGNNSEEKEDGDHERDTLTVADGAFRSMISFGHFSPSVASKTYVKNSSLVATTINGDGVSPSNHHHYNHTFNGAAPGHDGVPVSVLAWSTTDASVLPLPRWRQAGFNGNVATDGTPLGTSSKHLGNNNNNVTGKVPLSRNTAALKQRGFAREAEHLVRVVLRTVPLLPLSALRDATSLMLDDNLTGNTDNAFTAVSTTKTSGTTASADGKTKDTVLEVSAEWEKSGKLSKKPSAASRYNPLELALAIYTHTCAVPSTFGAQLIPADFFEQAWKLKLIVLTAKGGGYDVARRIVRDIEASRRRCFLETVYAMLHAPPPSTRGGDTDKEEKASTSESDRQSAVEEDTFLEALRHYLRNTSLTQRCGSVLLLNTVELRCTETTLREFVAPVFYKLCEPVGEKSSTAEVKANSNSGGGHSLHLPWKLGSSSGAHGQSPSPSDQQQQHSPEQLQRNVEMRRLFGTAIQRMTGQTCVAILALMAPKNVPQSFQRPPGTGGHSIGGALTPAELDAWATRAEEARRIFTPQKDTSEADPYECDDHNHKVLIESHTDPTAGAASVPDIVNSKNGSGGEKLKDKKSGPSFVVPAEGENAPQVLEERVWPRVVLLNVTVPLRYVSLLQGTLFFKSQMHFAATAGAQQMREHELAKYH